jgi:hypothetical protein
LIEPSISECICLFNQEREERTTDLAWDGQGLIYENGEHLAETERFAARPQCVLGSRHLHADARSHCAGSAGRDRQSIGA